MDSAEIEQLVMKPTARRRLGKYTLLGRIGHGGMGRIYLAYIRGPQGVEKLVAIKRLHSHLTNDAVLVASFLDEARLSMALSHPHIVSTYDVGDVDGRYFMVMEYVDGQNLGVLLRAAKRDDAYPRSALWAGMFSFVLDGLHAAHVAKDARGRPLQIVHRDVSPQNILLTQSGVPKLVDFGIAKAALRVNETDAGVLKGKYAYMSPEQVRSAPVDARSDIFAAGVVFWEMLAGRRLYKSDSVVRAVERILDEAPISPARVNEACDPTLAKVVVKALQKDPAHRFATALDFKDAIDDALKKSDPAFRPAEIQQLMARLFSEVAARQTEVLTGCLDGIAGDVEDDTDDDVRGGAGDSESDVGVRMALQRRDQTPHTDSRPAFATVGPGSAPLRVEPLGASVAAPFGAIPAQPRTGRVAALLPALLVVALSAVLVVVAVSDRSGKGRGARVVADAGITEAVANVRTQLPDAGTLRSLSADAGPLRAAQADAGAAMRVPGRRVAAASRPAPPDAGVQSAPEPRGMLTLDTRPWTTVFLGGRRLGETPLVRVVVPAGPLELQLVNAGAGVHETYQTTVRPGEELRVRLDLLD